MHRYYRSCLQWWVSASFACAGPALAAPAHAESDPAGVLALSAQASMQVANDLGHVTLAAEQDGGDPAAVAATLAKKADEGIAIARRVPGVTVSTGEFSLYPNSDNKGRIVGWRGRTEVRLESKDLPALSKLTGQMSGVLNVAGVHFSLSPEARQKAEGALIERAIASFRDKAQISIRAFGYNGYTIREVTVGHDGVPPPMPYMMRAKNLSAAADMAAVPMESGNAQVTVTVNGSVQMTR